MGKGWSRTPGRWALCALVLACGCGSGDDSGNQTTPSGDWEMVGYLRGCERPASLGIDAEDRLTLLCMFPQPVNSTEYPVLSTWSGAEFVTEPVDFLSLSDRPWSCDRLLATPHGDLGLSCLTSEGVRLAQVDGPAGQWSAPVRFAEPGDELVTLTRSGWDWGATALSRDAGTGAYVREWRHSTEGAGIYQWFAPVAMQSPNVGAADLAPTQRGWLVAYADEAQGGRLRLEELTNGAHHDYPDLTTAAVDLVRIGINGTATIIYRESGGPLRALMGPVGGLVQSPDVTQASVGEVALGMPSVEQVAYTDLDAGSALFVSQYAGSTWAPVGGQVSDGAASGIAFTALGGGYVSFCDDSAPGRPARVARYGGSEWEEFAPTITGECLATRLVLGFEAVRLAVLTTVGNARSIEIFHYDSTAGWTHFSSMGSTRRREPCH